MHSIFKELRISIIICSICLVIITTTAIVTLYLSGSISNTPVVTDSISSDEITDDDVAMSDNPSDTPPPESVSSESPVTETSGNGSDSETTEQPVTTSSDSVINPPETVSPPETAPTDNGNTATIVSAFTGLDAKYPDTVLPLTEDGGQEYIDAITFLGDSTTYGLRAYKMLSGGKETTQVWTPQNGTITLSYVNQITIVYPEDGTELTIAEAAQKKKPSMMVITLGVNGISFMKEDYFKSEYTKMIEAIKKASPDTKIILQSMFPVAKTYERLEKINNEKIAQGNEWIAQIAADTGVKFANTASVLIGADGYLPEEYHNGDGMHLNETSFTIELNYLRTHAYQ